MGDHCNVAFYQSEQDNLLHDQFMLYKRRGGGLWEVGPLLALSLLEVYEMFRGATERIHLSAAEIQDHHRKRLGQYGFRLPVLTSEVIFSNGMDVDFFYAVYCDYYEVGRIDVYCPDTRDWEFPLPHRTQIIRELEDQRARHAAAAGIEFTRQNPTFGLRKIKSIELFAMLKKLPD